MDGKMLLCLPLLVALASAAAVLPSDTVEGDATVVASGDFTRPGRQGEPCHLPSTTDVTITVGDVTLSLKVTQSPRVTQDALVFVADEDADGRSTLRRVAHKESETYALYHDTDKGAAMVITCPRPGETHPVVEGTVLLNGRKHHLREQGSQRRKRETATEPPARPAPKYTLNVVPPPKKPPVSDYKYPTRGVGPKHPPHPPAVRRLINDLEEELEEFERETDTSEPASNEDVSQELPPGGAGPASNEAVSQGMPAGGLAALGGGGRGAPRPPLTLHLKGSRRNPSMMTRRKRQTGTINDVTLETLAIVAYDLYMRFYNQSDKATPAEKEADTIERVKKHIAIVMSESDMHFALIGNRLPYTISLRLVGFIISKTAATSPWTEQLKEVTVNGTEINSSNLLDALQAWIDNSAQASLRPMDYYILFTDYNLYSQKENQPKSTATAGIAFVGGVCADGTSNTASIGSNVAAVETDEFAETVMLVLHEVGHGLGAQHDGDENSCQASDNFIMEPGGMQISDANRANYGQFSNCTLNYFTQTFQEVAQTAAGRSCLYDSVQAPGVSLVDTNVPDVSAIIPGQLYPADAQCKMLLGNESYVCPGLTTPGDEMCGRLFCKDPLTSDTCRTTVALRGTTCGDKKWCVRAQCVASDQAPSADESCLVGERRTPPYSNTPLTCPDLVAQNPGFCYENFIAQECCLSCPRARTGPPGCEYGDYTENCQVGLCLQYANITGCCGTCGAFISTQPTTTQSTTTQSTTTQPTTTQSTTTQPTTTQSTTTQPTTTASTTTQPTTTASTTTQPTTTASTTTQSTTTQPTDTQSTTTQSTTTQSTDTQSTTTQPTTTQSTTTQPTPTQSTTTASTTTQPTDTQSTTTASTTTQSTTTQPTDTQSTTTASTTTASITTASTTTASTTTASTTTASTTTASTTTASTTTASTTTQSTPTMSTTTTAAPNPTTMSTTPSTTAAPVPTTTTATTTTTTTAAPLPGEGEELLGQLFDANLQCSLIVAPDSSAAACAAVMARYGVENICSRGMACYQSPRFYQCGSRYIPLNGTSCGDKKWCINRACVSSPNAPSMATNCLFGDVPGYPIRGVRQTCAQMVRAGYCHYRQVRDVCCKSCNELAAQNPQCPLGDQPGEPFDEVSMTCQQLVSTHPGICYQELVRNTCCKSCADVPATSQNCRYGDYYMGCRSWYCRYYGNICCATCPRQP